jgi:hypothetical protein
MYKLIDNILTQFRSCFKRNSTFANFVIIVIGMLLRKDFRGVSSIVSSLRLKPQCYDNLIHFFRTNILVPYKRHCSESIETVITGNTKLTVVADETTLWRWRCWFQVMKEYFQGCLLTINFQYQKGKLTVEAPPIRLSQSPLQRIWCLVGDAPGWLARVVRSIANLNFWVHTRSAFLS